MIHYVTPYRTDRNLGKAYNDTFKLIPDEDWLIITDYDVLLLLPDTIRHVHEYVAQNPTAAMLTCWANRTYHSNEQLYGGKVESPLHINHDPNILNHIEIAKNCTKNLYTTTEINRTISGFFMVVSKKTWNNYKFPEDMRCLGVDSLYSQKLVDCGEKILRMNGIYVFHSYRLDKLVTDKSHLL